MMENLNNQYQFLSQIKLGSSMPNFSMDSIKNEPMFFNCSLDFVRSQQAPITHAFIERLLPEYQTQEAVIDTRVHMLMPGWYPCIPGWHHDDVPRTTPNGQPNYISPEYHAKHAMALVNADIAPTQFLLGSVSVPIPFSEKTIIYELWDNYLENQYGLYELGQPTNPQKRFSLKNDQVVYFDAHTFHRGTMSSKHGWRWFGRVTIHSHRKVTNEIRKQVQVYLDKVNVGW